MMGLAGIIEFFGGLAIAVGFFSRLAALGSGLEMIVAYFMVHLPQGLNPFVFPPGNGGELALMYLAAFLIVLAYGNGKWNLEKAVLKKELF